MTSATVFKEHQLKQWFSWVLNLVQNWDRKVLQVLFKDVPFVRTSQDFALRFSKTLQVVLLQSERHLLADVPDVQNVIKNSIKSLLNWVKQTKNLMRLMVTEQEETLNKLF
jgi:hypothetical protein